VTAPKPPANFAELFRANAILASFPEEKQKRVANMVNALHLQLMQEEYLDVRALALEIMRHQSVAQMRAEMQANKQAKAGGV
jgi:uncharacterized phage protein gp47/JayE